MSGMRTNWAGWQVVCMNQKPKILRYITNISQPMWMYARGLTLEKCNWKGGVGGAHITELPSMSLEDKIRGGYIALAFSGAHKWAELLHSRGPREGGQNQKWLHHRPCLLGGSQKRRQNQKWLHHPYFLGAQQVGGIAASSLRSRGPHKRGQNQTWLHHPCLLGGPQVGGVAASTLRSRGSPEEGTNSEVATTLTCFLRGLQVGGTAMSPLRSRGSPEEETKSEMATSPLPSWGFPEEGANSEVATTLTLTSAFSGPNKWAELVRHPCVLGDPRKRGQNKWPHHPCVLGRP